jgi:hypothetical protein
MKPLNRLFRSFTLLLGSLGVLLCVAAAVGVWFAGARLNQATDKVFDAVDRSLVASRDRVLTAQKRVQESKITAEYVGQAAQNWMRAEVKDRVTARLEIEEKTERLGSGLRQADQWLEVSGESLQGVQKILEIARSLGAPADAAVVDPLLEKLGAVRGQLQRSADTVDAIRARMAEGDTLEERLRQIAQLTLRVVATFSEIDSRLGEFADGLGAGRANVEQRRSKTHAYILVAQIAAFLLILWMAAGQVSLARSYRSV